MRILIEAAGSLTSNYLIKAIQESGHICIATDIHNNSAGAQLANEFIKFPQIEKNNYWEKIEKLIIKSKIDLIIPSFDEMMIGWAERKNYFKRKGTCVLISPIETIQTFQDKWRTYTFFKKNNIPTPETSLRQKYALIKPIFGRGAKGQFVTDHPINMNGYISQQIVRGDEYTIDCLFDINGIPIYIIPRIRQNVKDGKSTSGITKKNKIIEDYILKISKKIVFNGPINFQCFRNHKNIYFIEINPRIAGGMALGFAASENWIPLIIRNFIMVKRIIPQKIIYGLKMYRYYAEYFTT